MKNWIIEEGDEKKAEVIANDLGINKNIAKVLVRRGIDTTDKVNKFMNYSEKDIADISLLEDANKALDRIEEALNLGEEIVIYADYDADGTCSCSVMIRALRKLGAKVNYYTNDRLRQGFGMKVDGVKEILQKFPNTSLIITVDNGIVAFEAAEYIRQQGIDLIITDHHEPSIDGLLPEALAVVDHKRFDDNYPFKELCGTGIAYRLMQELYKRVGAKEEDIYDLLPLVAVGTVADCVSMTEENRFYVKEGLKKMGEDIIPAFKVFSELFKVKSYNEDTVGYYYGPAINSSSRIIGNANLPIDFFTTDNYDEALKLGTQLYKLNEDRKSITNGSVEKAEEQIKSEGKESDNVIIVYDKSFEEGIVGIIAGRITEKYHKPSIVFTENSGKLKGSARSVEGFNIKEAFDEIADTIVQYGGHAMAAGITIEEEDLDLFNKQLNNYAEGMIPDANNDIIIELNLNNPTDIDIKLFNDFNTYLRPFGTDFPVVKTRVGGWKTGNNGYPVYDVRYLKDIHLKVTNRDSDIDYALLMFNNGVEFYEDLLNTAGVTDTTLEAIGDFDINVFKGNISYQLIVQDNQLRIQK